MKKLNVFTLFKKYMTRSDRDTTPLLINSVENGMNYASGKASPSPLIKFNDLFIYKVRVREITFK